MNSRNAQAAANWRAQNPLFPAVPAFDYHKHVAEEERAASKACRDLGVQAASELQAFNATNSIVHWNEYRRIRGELLRSLRCRTRLRKLMKPRDAFEAQCTADCERAKAQPDWVGELFTAGE